MRELAAICSEAVRLHGADWSSVQAHIDGHLAALTPDETRRLEAEVRAAAATPDPGARERPN